MRSTHRRRFLGLLSGGLAGILAGCAGGGAPGGDEEAKRDADVIAGPDGAMRFEPEELTVPVGGAVTWYFDSGGHNVSCRPADSDRVRLPEGADPFASFGADGARNETRPRGETYSHTFEVPGEYTYVCVPHITLEMVASVTVEE